MPIPFHLAGYAACLLSVPVLPLLQAQHPKLGSELGPCQARGALVHTDPWRGQKHKQSSPQGGWPEVLSQGHYSHPCCVG